MKLSSIRRYLREQKVSQRWSTFNGAFQGALAICDKFEELQVAASLEVLGQAPNADLRCVYCGKDAATWDHLVNNVQNKRFSGHGNRIYNLVPACRTCNERKRNLPWKTFFDGLTEGTPNERRVRRERLVLFEALNSKGTRAWQAATNTPEVAALLTEYYTCIQEVRKLIDKADVLAAEIRKAVKEHDQEHQ